MAIAWTNYLNGDTLLNIRNKINSFSTSVVTDVNNNTSSISALQTIVTGNTSNIATNTTNIGTNTTDITDLKTKATFISSYDYVQGNSITVTGDVYEEIARLTTPSREAGIYKLSQSMMYSLNSTTNSAYFRFSTNGGSTWSEIRREPKDNLDVLPSAYTSTIVHPGGVFDLVIQSRKENAADTLSVLSIDVIFERKA